MKQKSENRKALPKFLMTLLVAGVIGGAAGGLSVFVAIWMRDHDFDSLSALLQLVSLWALPISAAVLLGMGLHLYRAADRAFRGWDGEEEAVMERAEEQISWALLWDTLAMILSFFFFTAGTVGLMRGGIRPSMVIAAEFVLVCALEVFLQQKLVDLTKQMNPEKKGSVYDKEFRKIWWESCDENERRQIGQASYKAFTTVTILCPVLWGVLFFGNIIFDYGILPATVALVIWAVSQISYTMECIRLSRGRTPGD